MDKFLLAENPMRPDNTGCFLIHAIPPFALIRAQLGVVDMKKKAPATVSNTYAFRNSDGVVEDWTLYVHYIEANAKDASHILDRAWRWYRAYMEWEDEQINNQL